MKTVKTLVIGLSLTFCCAAALAQNVRSAPTGTELNLLLSRMEKAPLAYLALPDIRSFQSGLQQTALAEIWNDPRYTGREKLLSTIAEHTVINLADLFARLKPNLEGPAVLALVQDPEKKLQWQLHLCATDPEAKEILAQTWERVSEHAATYISRIKPVCFTLAELRTFQPATWLKPLPDSCPDLVLRVNTSALLTQLPSEPDQIEDSNPVQAATQHKALIKLAKYLRDLEIEHFEWQLSFAGKGFDERMTVNLIEEANGTFSKLIGLFRSDPLEWNRLAHATPGGREISILLQTDPSQLSEELLNVYRLIERQLRGHRWTERDGLTEVSLAADRFDFMRSIYGGAIGVTAAPSASGEPRLTLTFATREQDPQKLRSNLTDGLDALDAPFRTQSLAPKIGTEAPLAARFKGRGLFKAPVIGLSKGWVWLCANTASYSDLISTFADSRTLVRDLSALSERGYSTQKERRAAGLLLFNLERLVPIGYALWIFQEGGPQIGAYQIPVELLPPSILFNGRMSLSVIEIKREQRKLLIDSRSNVPGGSGLPIGGLYAFAQQLERLKAEMLRPPPAFEEQDKPRASASDAE